MMKPKQLRRTGLAAALVALPFAVSAQEAVTTLQPLVVSAPKIESGESARLEPADIAPRRPATSDTASLLRDTPGVSLYGAGGVSSLPAIHGLADDRLRIKVDGMDLISACGNHMNPPLSYIDPNAVGSIKVFAGIAPVSSGGDSIGGTVLVDSPVPEFAAPGQDAFAKGELGAFYRSNGNSKGGSVAATVAGEKLSVRYSGATANADDYSAGGDFKAAGPAAAGRDRLDSDVVGSSMYESTNHALGFALRHDNHLVELKLGTQHIPYQGWPNQRMDMTGNDSEQANLRYTGRFGWGGFEARAYHEHTRHKMQFYDDKLFWYGPTAAQDGIAGPIGGCPQVGPPTAANPCRAAGMPMDTEGWNSGLLLKADIDLSARDLLRIGAETQRYKMDDWWDPSGKGMWPGVFWDINDGQRDRQALFAEWEAKWSQRWLTQFGLRGETVDMNSGPVQGYSPTFGYAGRPAVGLRDDQIFNATDRSKTDHNVDATLLARYTPSAMQTIEFGLAQKTRSPNLYERYTWSTHGMAMRMINMTGDGNGYVGNIDLKPEMARTLSATFDWHDPAGDAWGIALTPYFTQIDDYISAARCSSGGNACTAANANPATTTAFVYLKFVNESARLHGVDISGHFPLGRSENYGSFSGSGRLNYVRGKNRTTDDNLANIMPINAKLALTHKRGGWSGTIEAEMVGAKDDVSTVRNEMKTAGYGLGHLRASYEWKRLRVDLGIENLFDRLYSHPLGGAYMGQGKTMSATDVAWGVTVPGMGRSIYAGVNLKL
jgi:iron complex outermembrane receptor protein